MVSGISAFGAGSSLLPAQTAAAPSTGGALQTASPPSPQTQNALDALKTLSQPVSSANDTAKSAAIQKLEELKNQLKALMMLGGDPKQRAKEAAAIAQQIAAAAQAYAQAGGDASTLATSGAASDAGAGTTAVAPSETGAEAASSPNPGAAPVTTPAAGANASGQADAGTAGQGQGDGSTGNGSANVSAAASTTTAPAQGGSSQMDQAFMQEAQNLAHQAKAIIQAAEQRLKLQHQASDPTVAGAGDAAVAAVEASANQIGASSIGGYDGSIPALSTPAISITA